jgi:hypothetical protein
MDTVPAELFAADDTNFEQLLNDKSSSGNSTQLELCTLAGTQYFLPDLEAAITLADVKQRAAAMVGAPAHSIKLLVDHEELDCAGQTIADAGLTQSGAFMTLVRCPASRKEWVKLFTDLVHAIERRDSNEAKHLVDLGAGLDGDGNIVKASYTMRLPGDRTVRDDSQPGNAMLHLALRQGLTDLALYLISKGADVNSCSDVGRTPLTMAIIKKQWHVVSALLDGGADVSTHDYLGNTALTYALKSGNDELSSQLVALQGASVTEDGTFVGIAPLHDSDEVLLSGKYPILTCCACGLPQTAVSLLKLGVKPLGTDSHGRMALHYAYSLDVGAYGSHRSALLEGLLERGADATAVDKLGCLPACGIAQVNPSKTDLEPKKCTARLGSIWQLIF